MVFVEMLKNTEKCYRNQHMFWGVSFLVFVLKISLDLWLELTFESLYRWKLIFIL